MQRVLSASLVLLAVACEDDGVTPAPARLTPEEAFMVTVQLALRSETAIALALEESNASLRDAPPDGPPVPITRTLQSTHGCASGGRAEFQQVVSGTWDPEARALDIAVAGQLGLFACGVIHAVRVAGGATRVDTVSMHSTPTLAFAGSAATWTGSPLRPYTFEVSGDISWTVNTGRSGTCAVQLEGVTDHAIRRRTVTAELCGRRFTANSAW